jgi:hypothetical protein
MRDALTAAGRLIAATPALAQPFAGRKFSIGGFNIRRNANAKGVLSNHSFGTAIDIDAALNPNLSGRTPARAIVALSGEAFYLGEATMRIRQGGTATELVQFIARLRQASDVFKNAFATRAAVETAMQHYLFSGRGGEPAPFVAPSAGIAVVPLVESLAAATGKQKAAQRQALAATLLSMASDLPVLARRRVIETAEAVAVKKKFKDSIAKLKALRAELAAQDARWAKRGLDPRSPVAAFKAAPEIAAERTVRLQRDINSTIEALLEIWMCFVESFEPNDVPKKGIKKGERLRARTEGTRGSIAANGFFSLPPELVAALIGSDGGNLQWLGVERVKDMMHFQTR